MNESTGLAVMVQSLPEPVVAIVLLVMLGISAIRAFKGPRPYYHRAALTCAAVGLATLPVASRVGDVWATTAGIGFCLFLLIVSLAFVGDIRDSFGRPQ
jgi:hypothetical protein